VADFGVLDLFEESDQIAHERCACVLVLWGMG
jgi:hypothetical protein